MTYITKAMLVIPYYASLLEICPKEFLLAVAKTVLSATMKYAAPATAIINNFHQQSDINNDNDNNYEQ